MERYNWAPIYVHGMSLDGSYRLRNATHAMLELFYSLPLDTQQKVYYDQFSSEEMEASDEYRCEPSSAGCPLRFCLYGFFMFSGSIEEYAHYRQHGMCSQCKEKNDRRLARRKERLEGIARLNQAIRDDDWQGMDAYGHWCAAESDYDELSERDPDELEIMEMAMEADRLNNQMSDD